LSLFDSSDFLSPSIGVSAAFASSSVCSFFSMDSSSLFYASSPSVPSALAAASSALA